MTRIAKGRHGGGRGRPRNRERDRRSDVRHSERYAIARSFGLNSYEARSVAGSCESFVALLTSRGKDPADYGDLAVRLPGGKPRTDPERAARYRELRRRGLSAAAASRLSDKVGRYELTIKKLDRGIEVYA